MAGDFNHSDFSELKKAVTQLETDMKIMADAVSKIADSMHELVEMQREQALLRQDVDHKFQMLDNEQKRLDKEIDNLKLKHENFSNELTAIKTSQQNNTFITASVSKIGWAIMSALITGSVMLFFFGK